jgi:2',3'-cyclic-nucleotide 2'-phosphodiesterase/3'-nucleotidase
MTPSAPRLRLRIVATTDLHAHLAPYDYFRGDRDDGLGLAAAGALIEQAREEAANTLFFDNGDLLQGGPLGDFVASTDAVPRPHPMIRALADLGCDAATPGNHDFDFGLDFLRAAIESAPFPFVTSNVTKADGVPLIADHAIVERDLVDDEGGSHRVRIGVVGFAPPQVALWNKLHLDGRVVVEDMIEAARRLIPLVRERCDLLVALCHTGLSRRTSRPGDENAALAIARLGGVDAMVMGHQHLLFPGHPDFTGIEDVDTAAGTVAGVPAIMPGSAGGHIGVVDLVLHHVGGRWVRASAHSSLRSSRERAGRPPSPAVLAASGAWHEGTLGFVKRPVGHVASAITSHFGLVEDCGAVQIVNDAQRWFVATVAGDLGFSGLPILSACAPFRCGGRGGPSNYTDVAAGPVTLRDIADIYPFPNTLCILKVTGAMVRDWLEKSACLYRTIDVSATTPQQLTDPAFPSFDFDVIDGVDYTIDVTRPPRFDGEGRLATADHRIVGPTFAGSPLRDEETFLIATNNYRAFGGGGFPGLDGSQVVHVAVEPSRDVLARYIAAHPGADATPDHNWRLAPLPSHVAALVTSAPGISPSRSWRRTGATVGGFDEFQLVAKR